jgi:diguanylate cyclase (GGDEF)-like protein
VNDTYGHPVGDAVLKRVSGTISKIIRNIDVAARYGGEEFAVILVGTDARGAEKMAERLRRTVMDMKISAERNTFSVTVSIGIATSTGDAGKKEDIIERADKALYHSKRNGRNQSTVWTETGQQY